MTDPIPPLPPIAFCDECGTPYYRVRHDQIFHTPACKAARHARRINGGLRLYDAVMRWRIERPQNALREMTAIADQLAAEERIISRRRECRIESAKAAIKARKEA